MRSSRLNLLYICSCALACLAANPHPAEAAEHPTWLEDAELADVYFVDPQHGWAVGDRGVIWHSADGGQTWQPQQSSTEMRLQSVYFLNRREGWICGGKTDPYTHTTSGIVLHTVDGGRHWRKRSRAGLPALKRVCFFSPDKGFAVGEPSAMFTSGCFTSDDGGRSWKPLHGYTKTGWLTGDLIDPLTGALAGAGGKLAAVRRHALEGTRTPPVGMRGLRSMKLLPPTGGWLVGDGALVLRTRDLGRTWETPPAALPGDADDLFDWHALATFESHTWIAGVPGTRVLHTADGGQSWQWFDTGQQAPILGLHFADDRHGWAVGALGTILRTDDGGKSWTKCRAGGKRAALLAIYTEPEDIPLEAIARLSGNEGYFSIAHLVARRDLSPGQDKAARLPERTHEAMVALGGCRAQGSWRFPLPAPGLDWKPDKLLAAWDRANDGEGLARLEMQLVRQIRLWQPEVVMTSAASVDGKHPMDNLLNQLVIKAVERAADPTRYPELAAHSGLRAWKVRKVFGSLPAEGLGDLNLETSQMALRLGQTLADQAILSQEPLLPSPQPRPRVWGFQHCLSTLPQGIGKRDFMSGIALRPGEGARRKLGAAPPDQADKIRRAAERRRNLNAIIERSEKTPGGSSLLLGQIGDLVRDLPGDMAGYVLFNLGQQFARTGQWSMAAEMFDLLVQKHPRHPTTGKAAAWLVQYWASSEAAWREQQRQQVHRAGGVAKTGEFVGTNLGLQGVQTAALAVDATGNQNRPGKAAAAAKWLERYLPGLYHEPEIRFPLAVVHRRQGYTKQSERFYLNFTQGRTHDAWWASAAGEKWLQKPSGLPPKSVWNCKQTLSKPRLDGKLDETFWNEAKPVRLHSPQKDDADWPAAVYLAYDTEYLYLGVRCRRVPGVAYPTTEEPRPRDPDLNGHDRVHLYLDLDRDWVTFYHLTVDHRGWVAEDCWGDATWNPTWFVAAHAEQDRWTAEAAIPLVALSGKPLESKHVWGVGAVRTIPNFGFQSWTFPASPQGIRPAFGYLIFE